MRGIASIAKLVAPVAAIARTPSPLVSGPRKPIRVLPDPSRAGLLGVGGGDLDHHVGGEGLRRRHRSSSRRPPRRRCRGSTRRIRPRAGRRPRCPRRRRAWPPRPARGRRAARRRPSLRGPRFAWAWQATGCGAKTPGTGAYRWLHAVCRAFVVIRGRSGPAQSAEQRGPDPSATAVTAAATIAPGRGAAAVRASCGGRPGAGGRVLRRGGATWSGPAPRRGVRVAVRRRRRGGRRGRDRHGGHRQRLARPGPSAPPRSPTPASGLARARSGPRRRQPISDCR